MKKIFTLAAAFFLTLTTQAQKIDFNNFGRQEAEGLEPGYVAWTFGRVESATQTFATASGESIRLTLAATPDAAEGNGIRTNYWKQGVVNLGYKLLADACYTVHYDDPGNTQDDVRVTSTSCGLQLTIEGLPAGRHSLMAYHNAVDGFTEDIPPLDVIVDGVTLLTGVRQSVRATTTSTSGQSYVEFTATAGKPVVVQYVTRLQEGVTYPFSAPVLNAIIFDEGNQSVAASEPVPANADLHADADDGTCQLSWKAAEGAVRHHVWFGTDPANLTEIAVVTDTKYVVSDLYSMNTYYWRIDEEVAGGQINPGATWNFRPRHLAFPGAEGYGRFATGGRGGIVYHVTNLSNDNTPGSLLYGLVSLEGPRTIVFDVSGLIEMDFQSQFAKPFVTIAAQTAPGKGICLKYSNLNIGSESICRFLRARRGYGDTGNAMGVTGANHTIIDHTTCSWGTDETFSSRGAKNITFQYSMIAEALGIADHKNYGEGTNHGFAATIGGDVGTFSHNLLADCNGRNWSMGGGLDGEGYYSGRLDIFNNVVYNWHGRTTDGGAHEINFVGNYYKEGPAVDNHCIFILQLEGTGKGTQSAYLKNNILDKIDGTILTDASSMKAVQISSSQTVDWTYWGTEPYFPSYATIDSPKDAYKKVLSSVGAEFPIKDDNDKRMVHETLNRSYTYTGSRSGIKGEIDHEDDCGGFEAYPEETRAADFDTDQDGMPDWWERITGNNAQVADNNGDPDHDGYTNLEDYLNFLADIHVIIAPGSSTTVNLADYFAGFTASPTYALEGAAQGVSTTINDKTLTVAAADDASGVSLLKVSVTDSEGSTMTRQLGIAVTGEGATAIRQSLTDDTVIRSYKVFTLDGRLVKRGKVDGVALRNLPLSSIPSGVYVLDTIDADGHKHSCKIIK